MSPSPLEPLDHDAYRLRRALAAAQDAWKVLNLLCVLQDLQHDRGTPKADNETGRRAVGGHSDPTADTATDDGRLYLRDVLNRTTSHLTDAATALGGVRRGLERALSAWQGEDPSGDEGTSAPCTPPA